AGPRPGVRHCHDRPFVPAPGRRPPGDDAPDRPGRRAVRAHRADHHAVAAPGPHPDRRPLGRLHLRRGRPPAAADLHPAERQQRPDQPLRRQPRPAARRRAAAGRRARRAAGRPDRRGPGGPAAAHGEEDGPLVEV
ncbi:MAG: hypothetical protein AVDCRST_MAG41-2442, partial [uncultured Corynebacteriales bacterium]